MTEGLFSNVPTVVVEHTHTHKYLEVCHRRKLGVKGGEGRLRVFSRMQDSHVHDVRFMQRLMFDLWVDDGRVGDPCGVGTWGARHHVV